MYLSTTESWWIFEFGLQRQYPLIQKNPYHLLEEQLVMFDDKENMFIIANETKVQETSFLLWFGAKTKYPKV